MRYRKNLNIKECRYFGNKLIVLLDNDAYKLQLIQEDIFNLTDGKNTVEKIANCLVEKYNMEDSSIKTLVDEITNYCSNCRLFELVSNDGISSSYNKNIIGEKGKYYPKRIQVELTNACNFSCFHCYKSANQDKGVFLEDKMFYDLLQFAGYNLTSLGFTGGEPLLHPHFKKYVLEAKKFGLKLELNTNGSLIFKIEKEILSMFDRIAITLYGTNFMDYEKNCSNGVGFEMLKKSCSWLNENEINYLLNIVVSEDILINLEEYIKAAIMLGAPKVKIGTISKIGKAINIKNSNFGYNPMFDKKVYRTIRMLQNKYGKEIEIEDWDRVVYQEEKNIEPLYLNCCLSCNAGNLNWAMNESGMMKPCVMLPEEREFLWTFEQWKNYVNGDIDISWETYIHNYFKMCKKMEIKPEDYCESLSLVYNRK